MLAEYPNPLTLPDRVYAKTEKGRAEVAQRTARLDARARSTLIMLDGQKRCAALSGLLPMAALAPIIGQLEELGLIRAVAAPSDRASAAAIPVPAQAYTLAPGPAASIMAAPIPAPAPLPEPAHLAQAKATMIHTAETYLGLLAADVVRQVKSAEGKEQLQRALAHWHMAMQASKHGREVAAQHLQQIKASLQTPV